ncbi:MAG: discoidin domain-containing protein, partial [Bacteroidetes Order II. Incertae sedis bacterium]|nr:discoidin domain-containing protein [Bacteroidetes Order II. bacterium]
MSSKNFYGLTGDVTVDGGILNVGNAQLYANTETSNVGIGTTNPEFELDVRGDANVHNLYATYLHGDGSNIENIVSSQWEGSPGDPIYYASNVGIANTSPVTTTMQIGSNVVIDDVGSNVIHVTGNVHATRFIGDGAFLENIASNLHEITTNGNVTTNTVQFDGSTSLVTTGSVGIANTAPVHNLDIGSNLYVEDAGSNVLYVTGNIYADYLVGDGSQLTGIAASLDQIVDQGNTVSNTIQIVSGQDATSNIGLVTHDDVGISVSNTNPTGAFQFGVGSNLLVNVYSSNVLTVDGNVLAQKMTLGTVTVTPAYNLQQIMTKGATTSQTLVLENATTGLTTTSNVGIANTAPVHTLDVGSNLYVEDTGSNVLTVTGNVSVSGDLNVGSNLYVTERLDVGSNLHIENLRVAEVASNLVTYDSTTGEIMDSGGLFSNKLAVVSEQPPIALTGASTLVTNHGTYTIEASSGTVVNLFDKVVGESNKWVTDGNYSTTVGTEGTYDGSASLAGHGGEWVKITMPYKTILRHIKIESTNESVEDIELVGLNADGLTWTPLKTETGLTGPTHTIIVNATTHHRTYGLIVEKTNTTTGRSAVEIGDLKLFTESFSIDGGKVEMATSAVMGGETTMDQHGPHGRDGAAKLKKYPEIVFEEGKFDRNDTTNTYTQAGYTVTASTTYSTHRAFKAFNGVPNDFFHWQVGSFSNSDGTYSGGTQSFEGTPGEWLKIEVPNKIKPTSINLYRRDFDGQSPKDFKIYASITGSSWTLLTEQTGIDNWTNAAKLYNFDTGIYYKYFAILVTKITRTNSAGAQTSGTLGELQLYGYEEDPPAGDTSVDTTFTSIMNTPQTTGANVYVDGSLGGSFTNRVTGPDATGPSATYDVTGKYWELNGSLESNIAVEANTFLSGDQPHAVSVWFNSSNLEANVSNTCVFSISDQEKLDSVNLDLQSNTWHNLTYAYQGEGGSRVTYLDGRKVAEDQAEDTFGDYPPFAMTGYSQGGYVVSSNSENSGNPAWEAFDSIEYAAASGEGWETAAQTYRQSGDFEAISGGSGGSTVDTITDTNSGQHTGYWIKIEFPQRIRIDYARLQAQNSLNQPKSYVHLFSNNDQDWDLGYTHTTGDWTQAGLDLRKDVINTTKYYKYAMILVKSIRNT